MSALSLVVQNPQVLPPPEQNIREMDQQVRAAARSYRSSAMTIAYWGWRLRYYLGDDWSRLGVKDEDEYREALGLAQSTWYKYVRIGQALHQLKLADLQQITEANASLLMVVDPTIWHDYPWVQEAKTLSSSELSHRIVQRNRQNGIDKEPSAYYKCRVPFTAKKFLEETVEKYRQENNLATAGEALEMLVADVHDRPNVMAGVKRAHKYIEWAMFRLRKKHEQAEFQWLARAKKLLHKCYWAVRMEHSGEIYEEDAKEVYPAENAEDSQDFTRWRRDMFKQPSGPAGEETSDYVDVAPPSWYLREVPRTNEPDRDEDSFDEEVDG